MGPSTWLSAVPVALAAAVWVIGPGLLVLRAAGLRGLSAWGAAPMVSVALIATSAVLGTTLGLGWGPWVPAGTAVLLALAEVAFRGFLARRPAGSPLHRGWRSALRAWEPGRQLRAALVRWRTPRGLFARSPDPVTTALPQVWRTSTQREGVDGHRAGLAAFAGTSLAAALAWLTVVLGFGPVDQLSSTYDAVFHYNGVAHILGTGDASSLTLGTLTSPGSASAFYPAAWHDLVSLVAMTAGAGVPVATNLTAWSVAALIFPLSSLLLTRHTLGRSAGAAFAAPVIATAFTGFPWALMSFGVLWPNLLGVALLPAALTVVAALVGTVNEPVLRPPGAAVLAVAALPALGFAHPNAVFSLAVLGLFPILWALLRLTRQRILTSRFWQPLLGLFVTLGAVAVVVWLMVASPLLAGVRGFDWPAFTSTPEAVVEVFLLSTNSRPALWPIGVLVVVGAVAALRRITTSWLVPAHLASGFLYVLAASREDALTAGLTGAWYNDSYRLAAMLPVTGVPLAVLGVVTLAGLLRQVLLARPAPVGPALRRRGASAALVVGCVIALVLGYGGLRVGLHSVVLAGTYREPADVLLDSGQRQFLEDVAPLIPEDAVVAADPYTGNALLYPLTGREVLFPHLIGDWTPEQTLLATRMRDAASDPEVCAAAAATRVQYVLSGPVTFWPWHGGAGWYPGLHDLGPVPGFELVASGGGQELWRLTACDPANPADPDAQAMPPGAQPVPEPTP
ncbi:hypothetical protein SAMN05216207_100954 [Pseudonocardia ammonioxydans]|uniref:4-amino-4-deoxy-L-arabinose transferase n=1 Tax=Pseudonocardia ammonioxydans TaxID=260086 RepID=A0A1I4WR66_PSUAM|nr:DUF6541 family protein [Pseudonocardia ammonioxydans]SFN16291.1 hypothetical protein SAMN05216207_100954 [Pseudonocardia ammonioxydans]